MGIHVVTSCLLAAAAGASAPPHPNEGAADAASYLQRAMPLPANDEPLARASSDDAQGSDLQRIIGLALDDAARRTARDRSTLTIIRAEPVTWPDGSLGCPEPGVVYTMAPVLGYVIQIRAGNETLSYHASRRGVPIYCPPTRVVPAAAGGTT